MAQKIEKVDVWSGEIRDEVGGLDAVLSPLVAVRVASQTVRVPVSFLSAASVVQNRRRQRNPLD